MASSSCVVPPSLTAPPRLFCCTGVEASLKGKQLFFGKQLVRLVVTNPSSQSSSRPTVVAVLANDNQATVEFDKTTAVEYHSQSQEVQAATEAPLQFVSVDHVGSLCGNLERSLEFYVDVLGLTINPDRPASLPYRGAWLWVGSQMVHLMELDNPDPVEERPEYAGRDRHVCLLVKDLDQIAGRLEKRDIPFKRSSSGREALFCRDPDGNGLEFSQPR